MKRITKIEIDNYKAYASSTIFDLPKGQNLLLYGENGSGKSSLFRALHYFMESSIGVSNSFDVNYYTNKTTGKIEVTLCDFITSKNDINSDSSQTFVATEDPTTTTTCDPLLKTGYRISGFLDYSTLLKVYLNRGVRPNLYDLVINLLSEYIPINQGLSEPIGAIIQNVNNNICKCYHRSDKLYVLLRRKFHDLQSVFNSVIDDLNIELEHLMNSYFRNLDLKISLANVNLKLVENGYIRNTKILGELFLDVTHYGHHMRNYNSSLNEARLSAISICLYLASLKLRNVTHDLKILYLDDIFVGLDSSNRRPVINMLLSEFQEYQIFISTYDKSWYMLAREIINDESTWKFMELYEGESMISGERIPKPILISGNTDIEMARKYLYDNLRPDYPAAANYMRKAYEYLLSNKLYRPAIIDDDNLPIAAYRISALISRMESFLSRIKDDSNALSIKKLMNQLKTNLSPMLHPLSHYAPDEPVYKNELIQAESLYDEITSALATADYCSTCKVVVPKHGQLLFEIEGVGWRYQYIFDVEDHLISYTKSDGSKVLTDVPLQIIEMRDCSSEKMVPHLISKNSKLYQEMRYTSIDNCIAKIVEYLKLICSKNDMKIITPHTDMFYCMEIINNPEPTISFSKKLTTEI